MKKRMNRSLGTATFALALLGLAPAHAQDDSAASIGEEEQVDNGLKNFGYIAGLSRNCVAESQQVAFERDVLDMNASIARLLGVDRAFLFSAAFGYGTSVDVEAENCSEVLKQYEARTAKFRSAAQGG